MLNQEQKDDILKLRKKGYGYKSISGIVKINRDVVRDLCKRNGLGGFLGYGKSVPMESKKEIPTKQTSCERCGEPINILERRGRKARFCSDSCRRKWWYENQDKKDRRESAWYSFVCLYCGKDFKAYGNRTRKYCSRKCSVEHRYGIFK